MARKSTEIAQDRFIAEYFTNGGRKKAAAEKCEIGWTTVKEWFAKDAAFKSRVDEFHDTWKDNLRAVALRRASEKSDVLLMFMLKSIDPATYDDNLRKAIYLNSLGLTDPDAQKPIQITFSRGDSPELLTAPAAQQHGRSTEH